MKTIRLCDISLAYENCGHPISVFKQLNLHIYQGELLAILGPSGCGKTSLIRIIAGLESPLCGHLCIDQESWQQFLISKEISYVSQKPLLLPYRTVLDNVSFPGELKSRIQKEELTRLIHLTGLNRYTNLFPHQLSGGLQQRVALARAMITKPELVLMDEPFSALDQFTRDQLSEDYHHWQKQLGITTIFVTHQIEEAAFLADRIIILSPKPAHVTTSIKVNLPKTRHQLIRCSPGFFRITKLVRQAIYDN